MIKKYNVSMKYRPYLNKIDIFIPTKYGMVTNQFYATSSKF